MTMHDIPSEELYVRFGLDSARINNRPFVQRRLSDLRECFYDAAAYETALRSSDPVVYEVTSVEPATGDGQLHYGLGILYPGKVGDEFYMTKGHLHAHRPAAEIYVGLRGAGLMLLEDEQTGHTRLIPLESQGVVYVPGHTAHRTINTGAEPLLYLGIYPSNAGHDYGAIAERNFRMVVVNQQGRAVMKNRKEVYG
jgi:glucose-6-phosphate isomerase, archaeal